MEPGAPMVRPSRMRLLASSAAALLLTQWLSGCGSDAASDDVAADSPPTSATSSPSDLSSPSSASSPSSPSPTVGSYPEFSPTDYTYQLGVSCFCAFGGSPAVVTVANGAVVKAVYAQDATGRGDTHAGDPAPRSFWLTINDVIAEANDPTNVKVSVDWPAGQDYPNSVQVDRHADVADDEVVYTVADVQVR